MSDDAFRNEMEEIVNRGRIEQRERIDQFQRQQRHFWKQAAGDIVDDMFLSREIATNLLEDAYASIRSTAVEVLTQVWRVQRLPEFRRKFETMALTDPEPSVRASAVIALGNCYADSQDAEMGRFFGRIVSDESTQTSIREAAYHALFSVRGLLPHLVECYLSGFQFPSDVDWSFVSQCVNDTF